MALTLLDIPDGATSLELGSDDLARVRQILKSDFGGYAVEPWVDGAILTVGTESLLFVDDWDEPYLLARTEGGARILKHIERRDSGSSLDMAAS